MTRQEMTGLTVRHPLPSAGSHLVALKSALRTFAVCSLEVWFAPALVTVIVVIFNAPLSVNLVAGGLSSSSRRWKALTDNCNTTDILFNTRLHSSRMRTARSLTVSPNMLWGEGAGAWSQGGLLRGGGAWSQGSLLRGVCSQGGLLPGGLLPGGLLPGGVCSWGGGMPACTEADPPPVNRMTKRCKNITLLQTSFAGGNDTRSDFSGGISATLELLALLRCTYTQRKRKR